MREIRPSGSEGGGGHQGLSLPPIILPPLRGSVALRRIDGAVASALRRSERSRLLH
jgi:hypothetical protein